MTVAEEELRSKKNFISKTQQQIRAKSAKTNSTVWFTKRLKSIVAENDSKLDHFEQSYDLLYEESVYVQKVKERKANMRAVLQDKMFKKTLQKMKA